MSLQTISVRTEELRREVAKFLAVTRRRASRDLYRGRRAHARHHRSWPMLVAVVNDSSEGEMSVALHDASESGIGFRAPRSFAVGQLLAVKLFWHDPRGVRVPAIVRHARVDTDGAIVGCEFTFEDDMCLRVSECHPRWYEA